MIVGIIIRNIKTYRGINYIPISDEDQFCGLVGNNGIGKSSILEALDSFFNSKPFNLNMITKKSGVVETAPHVLPIFLINRTDINSDLAPFAEKLSQLAMEISESDVNPSVKGHIKKFISHREMFRKKN